MDAFDELNSPRAIACRRQVHGEQGSATVQCVVLADGHIIECGSDFYAERRAKELAKIINSNKPERFLFRKD